MTQAGWLAATRSGALYHVQRIKEPSAGGAGTCKGHEVKASLNRELIVREKLSLENTFVGGRRVKFL